MDHQEEYRTMSSLGNIMDAGETLTWVEQPALKPSTLVPTQEVIGPEREPDGATVMPPYAAPISR